MKKAFLIFLVFVHVIFVFPVETNKMSVTTMGQLTTKGYVVPGRADDESGEATSWVDVVRKKRSDGSGRSSRLVGKQSVDMLTLFTKQK